MLGVVLIVMVGESVQEMQLAGWLPETTVALSVPGWVGLWFAIFPTVEGLVAQGLAVALVLGSYFGAEYWRVKRPRRQAPGAAPQRSIRAETTASYKPSPFVPSVTVTLSKAGR
jgi:high-affinity iron transporter